MVHIPVRVDTRDLEIAVKELDGPVEPALQIIGEILTTRIDDLIQSEGATGVKGSWDPFSSVTFKLHPGRRGGKLLQKTGQLASMQTSYGSNWVQVGSPAPYAAAHITGVLDNPMPNMGPIPSRDFLAIHLGEALDEAADSIAQEKIRLWVT